MGEFKFPRNNKAESATIFEQADKLVEEAAEVKEAVDNLESDSRVLEETFDVINACEGILRKYTKDQREAARDMVRDKCAARGDYDV